MWSTRNYFSLAVVASLLTACGGGGNPTPSAQSMSPQSAGAIPRSIAYSRKRLEKAMEAHSRSPMAAAVGSSQPATADMPVPRPHNITPCIVPLFTNVAFADFSPKPFSYASPSMCPGPWSKVVFDGDFNVTAGVQFDRTASVWIGGTNIYFGTTAEPLPSLSPSWHVERDITDLSAVLASSSSGEAVLGNLVDSALTSVITGSAKLEFYPAKGNGKGIGNAPQVADVVLPLANSPAGDNVFLSNPSSLLSGTFTFPRNVESAYINVYLQSQSNDEFWYTCVSNDIANELQSCGNTSFREGEVTIDGQIAGVAPVYPWIYSGGIDFFLWRPIPGVETFDFTPYRVNLTPFAGILDDGNPHTVAVSVFNANNGFSANAAVELFLDHRSSVVSGGLLSNTTAASPTFSETNGITTDSSGNISGPVNAMASHGVQVSGYVQTSHGRVQTTVSQTISFSNVQTFTITSSVDDQIIKQLTSIASQERTSGDGDTVSVRETRAWPINVNFAFVVNSDGSGSQTTTVHQARNEAVLDSEEGLISDLSNTVDSTDTLLFDASFNIAGNANAKSSQHYIFRDNQGTNYNKTITSANNVITSL